MPLRLLPRRRKSSRLLSGRRRRRRLSRLRRRRVPTRLRGRRRRRRVGCRRRRDGTREGLQEPQLKVGAVHHRRKRLEFAHILLHRDEVIVGRVRAVPDAVCLTGDYRQDRGQFRLGRAGDYRGDGGEGLGHWCRICGGFERLLRAFPVHQHGEALVVEKGEDAGECWRLDQVGRLVQQVSQVRRRLWRRGSGFRQHSGLLEDGIFLLTGREEVRQ